MVSQAGWDLRSPSGDAGPRCFSAGPPPPGHQRNVRPPGRSPGPESGPGASGARPPETDGGWVIKVVEPLLSPGEVPNPWVPRRVPGDPA